MAQKKESKCVGVDMVESSNHLYSSKKATVEVTIKVKKQRHPSKHKDHQQEEQGRTIKPSEVFPKGWKRKLQFISILIYHTYLYLYFVDFIIYARFLG